jgi:hypothetical protein
MVAHMLLHQELWLPDLSSSQVTYSCSFQKIWFFVRLLTSFLPPFPVWSVAASHIFCLSITLCVACGSVYLIILNKNINSLYKFTWLNHLISLYPHSSKIDSKFVCTITPLCVSCYTPSTLSGFFPHGHCRTCWIFVVLYMTVHLTLLLQGCTDGLRLKCHVVYFLNYKHLRKKSPHSKFGHRGLKKICMVADIIAFI